MIRPAARIEQVQEYYFSRKLKEVAKMRAEGKDIISLAIGSPDMPPSPQTIEKLCEVARQPYNHGYQPSVGIAELRQAMAGHYKRWYGVDIDWQTEVVPLIGSKEGILHTTLALCNPGDGVLIPNPGYPTYTALNRILGTTIKYYDLLEDDEWQPDFRQLDEIDTDCIKVLWANYPHMPTGGRARMKTFERLVQWAEAHNVMIVHDNPYALILNKTPMSIMQVDGAKDWCIELNSMSKSFNMPGWRVAMAVSNAQVVSWLLRIKSNIDNGTFRGIQEAAAEAFNTNTDEWHEEYNFRVYEERRRVAQRIMDVLGCSYDERQTGMFLWGRTPDTYTDAEQLTEILLHEACVFVTPGFIFGSKGKQYIRISLCATVQQMEEALKRIETLNLK